MNIHISHAWNVSIEQAQAIQRELASQVIRHNQFDQICTVAGVDLSFPNEGTARAAAVVFDFQSLALRTAAVVDVPVAFPYVPGLLAFRETPAALAAFEKLDIEPDLIFVLACCRGYRLPEPTRWAHRIAGGAQWRNGIARN